MFSSRIFTSLILVAVISLSASDRSRAAVAETTAPETSDLPNGALSIGGMGGDDVMESQVDFLVPLCLFENGSLLYINPRFAHNDDSEEEFNLGLGFRFPLADKDVILGGNLFYDSRWPGDNTQFNQAGVGLELLSTWVDFRANYYIPEDTTELVNSEEDVNLVSETSTISYERWGQDYSVYESRTIRYDGIYQHDLYETYRGTLEGYDAEIGVKLPLPNVLGTMEARVYGGVYSFESNLAIDDIEGWKARLEVRALPAIILDAQVFENDELFGVDYMVGVRLRVPFSIGNIVQGRNPFEGAMGALKKKAPRFSDRLTESVMRDPHIQLRNNTTVSTSQQASSRVERNTYVVPGMDGCVVFVDSDNGAADATGTAAAPLDTIQASVDAAPDGGCVVVRNGGVFNENVGIDRDVDVLGENIVLSGNGTPSTVNGGGGMDNKFALGGCPDPTFYVTGNNVTIAGLDIMNSDGADNRAPGIRALNPETLSIYDNTFHDTCQGVKVELNGANVGTVYVQGNGFENLMMDERADAAPALKFYLYDDADLTAYVEDNVVSETGGMHLHANDMSTANVSFLRNTLTDNAYSGIMLHVEDFSVVSALIEQNTIKNGTYYGIGANVFDHASLTATITDNTISGFENASLTSSSWNNRLLASGIRLKVEDRATLTVNADRNTISECDNGIRLMAKGTAVVDATAMYNTVDDSSYGISFTAKGASVVDATAMYNTVNDSKYGMYAQFYDASELNINLSYNTVSDCEQAGIWIRAEGNPSGADLHALLMGNTVENSSRGLWVTRKGDSTVHVTVMGNTAIGNNSSCSNYSGEDGIKIASSTHYTCTTTPDGEVFARVTDNTSDTGILIMAGNANLVPFNMEPLSGNNVDPQIVVDSGAINFVPPGTVELP